MRSEGGSLSIDHGAGDLPAGDAPGTRYSFVAAFTSKVTDVLGDHLGMRLAVIAATAHPERLRRRLSETWHAAWTVASHPSAEPFRRAHAEPSDVHYKPLPFEARRMTGRPYPSGVSFDAGNLRVALPVCSEVADLGELLGLALDDVRYDVLAQNPSAVRRRHAAGQLTEFGPRYARRPGRTTVALVRNVYAFSPGDLPDLVAAVALARSGLLAKSDLARARARSPVAVANSR